jgi:GNAT superfamily N-acetyltransferase
MATIVIQPQPTRTGPSEVLQILRNLRRRCGLKFAVLWLLQGTVCRVLKLRIMHIIIQDAKGRGAAEPLPPAGYELRVATAEELARGVPDDPTFPDRVTLQQYIDGGDLMIAAFHRGQIVSYGWCSSGPANIGAGLTLSFGPRYLYGHRAYTTQRHRGKGLHAAIIGYSRQVAKERGQIMVAYVDANNYRSLESESRVGKIWSGVVVIGLWPGRLRYWASALCLQTGLSVSSAARVGQGSSAS